MSFQIARPAGFPARIQPVTVETPPDAQHLS